MKRAVCFNLIFYLALFMVFSQDRSNDFESVYMSFQENNEVVDTALLEIVYSHSMFDPVKKSREVIYEMLALGENFSKYADYRSYKDDSLSNANAGQKYWHNDWFNGPNKEFTLKYGRSREKVQKSYKDSTLHFEGYIMDFYYYVEPLHQMKWSLGDETKEILGYECRKATCRWRGRDWTAWYSELPYSDGPWMFGGLPGLIMELTDSTGEHKIRAKGIKRDVYPFGLPRTTRFRSKRERYLSNLADYIENAAARFMESGMVISGLEKEAAKPRRLFYCPLELE